MPINLFGGESAGPSDSDRLGGGKVHAGFSNDGQPESCDAWRFSTADPDAAERIAELFGGKVEDNDHEENIYQVFTEAETLPIVLSPGGIFTSFILWANNVKTVETDGTYLIEDGVVTENPSPLTHDKSLDEILAMGFKVNLQIRFTIEGAEDIGSFALFSGARTALADIAAKEAELAEIGSDVTTTLTLQFVETKKGGYRKPQIGQMTPTGDGPFDDTVKQEATKKPAAKKAPAKKAAKKATRKRVSK